jgi:hypothetical protein
MGFFGGQLCHLWVKICDLCVTYVSSIDLWGVATYNGPAAALAYEAVWVDIQRETASLLGAACGGDRYSHCQIVKDLPPAPSAGCPPRSLTAILACQLTQRPSGSNPHAIHKQKLI